MSKKINSVKNPMSSVIFYQIAEYCYYVRYTIIKHKGKEIQTEIWASESPDKIIVTTKKYKSKIKAYRNYKIALGNAVIGQSKILNALPQKVEWKKDTIESENNLEI